MLDKYTPTSDDLEDLTWMSTVFTQSSQYLQDETTVQQRIVFSQRLKSWRLENGYKTIRAFSEYLHTEIPNMPIPTVRRLTKLMEYANNPHRQYSETVLVNALEGISSITDLEQFREKLSTVIDQSV